MKTKHDYIATYESGITRRAEEGERLFWRGLCSDPDLYADDDFENTATVDEIVGYYLYVYADEAFSVWSINTENITLSATHKEVDSILKQFDEEADK